MKTKIISIFASFYMIIILAITMLSFSLAANAHEVNSIGEYASARSEMHKSVCHTVKYLFGQKIKSGVAQDLDATIYYEVKNDQTIHFYRIDGNNTKNCESFKQELNAQKLTCSHLLSGGKFKFHVRLDYVEP